MDRSLASTASPEIKKVLSPIVIVVTALMGMTLFTDALRSSFRHSAFYLAESLLFSSFWLLFLPLTLLQYRLAWCNQGGQPLWRYILQSVLAPAVLHLLLYPLLVSLLSALFYYHTYSFLQTLQYSITEDMYKLLAGYGAFAFFTRRRQVIVKQAPAEIQSRGLTSLTIQNGRKYSTVAVKDILYFRASTPYIILHLDKKQYLYTQTLSSLHNQLGRLSFIRIHRSTVVNVEKVVSWKSRLNGDYDISLQNGESLRLSRNYVAQFREAMEKRSSA